MTDNTIQFILEKTNATALKKREIIQELWSGYGQILRIGLEGTPMKSIVVKQVQLPSHANHPRGWNSNIGHQRKIKSYQVESTWYRNYSTLSKARLPKCISINNEDEGVVLILEDLDAAGYPLRKQAVNWEEIKHCIQWLATFHASYLDMAPDGLWHVGTYWHLDTRPHELSVLDDIQIQEAAPLIDQKLNNCKYKTIVHGDAKLANFCFSHDGTVAGVDFQYVGGGCGMKDLVYFVGSCLYEKDCERLEEQILDTYFGYFQKAIPNMNTDIEIEWRSLYRVAWADFHRFLKGWNPGHWKINSYSEHITAEVIKNL